MEQRSESTTQEKADKLPRTMADITPLEPPFDSFMSSIEQAEIQTKSTGDGEILASLQTHTPPETPELPHLSTIAPTVGHDLPLFPDSPLRDRTRSLSPLLGYRDSEAQRKQQIIDRNEHQESNERYHRDSLDVSQRTQSATYPGILGIRTAQDALDYHRSCMEEQRRWQRELALPPPARSGVGARRDVTSAQQLSRLNKSGGISKPHSLPVRTPQKPVTSPAKSTTATTTTTTSQRKASESKKRASRPKATSEGPSETSQGQKKHTRAAPTKNVSPQDWTEIEDVTPPLSMLDGKSYELKWHGNLKDISEEPDLQHLHPLEVRWASRLRLDPRQYLATKRRIFKKRVESIRTGQKFTKTAAQQVANLDVNKLSRLHEAFEAVGWFDEALFQQHIRDSPMQ